MVARVEFNDQELPILKFLKNIITKISEFFINIFKNAKFDPNKMVWYHYLLLVIILIPIGIVIIGFIVNLFKGVIIYRYYILYFIIILILYIFFIMILITLFINVNVVSELNFLNIFLQKIKYVISLIVFGFFVSFILAPSGIGKIKIPLIYLKDAVIVIFIISFILLLYNFILLYIIE
jgi:hypothetical protein